MLGRRLVGLLAARGHEVRGLARSPAAAERVRAAGGHAVDADLFDAESLTRAAEGCEALIHAATAIPQKQRATMKDFALNDRIRRDGTRAMIEAAQRVNAKRLVFQSIVWAARPDSGAPFDESSPPGPDPVAQSALDGEEMIAGAGFSTLRCGWFYGSDAGTKHQADALAKRRLPLIAGGAAKLSFLHLDDAAAAFAVAAERAGAGLWHVVDDQPASTAEFFGGLAQRIGAPPPRSVPKWIALIGAGRIGVSLLTTPMITGSARFKRDFGWMPRYPTCRDGLGQVVAEWRQRRP